MGARSFGRQFTVTLIAGLGVAGCATVRAEPLGGPRPAVVDAPGPRAVAPGPASESPITFERMSRYPEPGWQVPRAVAFAGDGRVTFLQDPSGGNAMAILGVDGSGAVAKVVGPEELAGPGEEVVGREEELRRERQRQKLKGITSYAWSKRGATLVVPYAGDVFAKVGAEKVKRLTRTSEPELDPHVCDDGSKVSFVRGRELVVVDVATGRETEVTRQAPAGVTRGQTDFNAQEEFDEPSGHAWSPTCDRLAWFEVDERGVGEVPILGFRGGPDLMQQRYPRAGSNNPVARLMLGAPSGGRAVVVGAPEGGELALGGARGGYAGRLRWSEDGATLWLQVLTRDQKQLSLLAVDARTGRSREVLRETRASWVDFAEMRPVDARRFVWSTMRAGHTHLDVVDASSGERRPLTEGPWDVESLEHVDSARGEVVFVANRDDVLDRQLYAVPLAGGAIARRTSEPGVHAVVVAPDGSGFVDVHSALDRLPAAVVRDAAGGIRATLPTPRDPDLTALALRVPERFTVAVPEDDGAAAAELHGLVLKPRDLVPGATYPVVWMVYGGPGVQTVQNRWSARLFWQHLADRGFVVAQVDNRGTSGRGPAFASALAGRMGDLDLRDQLRAVDEVSAWPYVAADRIGIYGHSYGGFLTLQAMFQPGSGFRAGAAGAPVSDFSLYDSGYTERYLGTPAEHPAAYARTDLARGAANLEGRLLLVHALMDENVHFENSARVVDALVEAGKPFDQLVLPGERHGYANPKTKAYVYERVATFFADALRP